MNRENLRRMADYIATVPQSDFTMVRYRLSGDRVSHKCGSVGCVVGHCTVLDNAKNIPVNEMREIDFGLWSERFTGLTGDQWDWCFSDEWTYADNTPEGASKRINYLLEHGLPENSYHIMIGEDDLPY